jgi:hypothetical protein
MKVKILRHVRGSNCSDLDPNEEYEVSAMHDCDRLKFKPIGNTSIHSLDWVVTFPDFRRWIKNRDIKILREDCQ